MSAALVGGSNKGAKMALRKRGNAEGSIYKMADGRWRGAITTGWKLNADGNKIPKRKTVTKATRHEVADEVKKLLRDQQQGITIDPQKSTVGDFLKSWLKDVVKPSVRPKTLRTYGDFIKLHLAPQSQDGVWISEPFLGSLQLSRLGPQHVRALLNERLTTLQPSRRTVKSGKDPEPGKPLAARTVKHLLVTLRTALESAVKDGLVPRNVADLVAPPSVAKPQMKTFTPEHARTFLEAIRGDRYEAVFATAIALGYRQGEALGLQWPDVNLDGENCTITVRQSIQRIDGKLTITPTKKDKIHTVPLPAVTRSILIAQRARQAKERQVAGTRWQENGFVFTTSIGTPDSTRS
jgi:integrase